MTSQNRTYYEILGVSEDASFEEIRAAFREKAREFHPDRNPDPDAVERMQEINEAYEVLRDQEERVAYDRAHRTFTASPEALARAKATAAMVLGQIACNLGFSIGAKVSDQWNGRIRRLEDIPTGVWHAGYEVALESALTGRRESEVLQAASDAAWHAVQIESARLAYRHALAERAETFTDSFAVDIEVNILGSTAAVIGFALGRQNIYESLPASAWNQADEAIRGSVRRSIQLRGGVVTPQTLRDNSFINSVFEDAAQEANRVLRAYSGAIGRRIGRPSNRGTTSTRPYSRTSPSGRGDQAAEDFGRAIGLGCAPLVLILIGLLIIVSAIGLFSNVCSSITYDAIRDMEPGDCIDARSYEPTSCSATYALEILDIYEFPEGTWRSNREIEETAEEVCPLGTASIIYPSFQDWYDKNDRALACLGPLG